MRLSWGYHVATNDAWLGKLEGVLVNLDTRTVARLVVKRGLFFPKWEVAPATFPPPVVDTELEESLAARWSLALQEASRPRYQPIAVTRMAHMRHAEEDRNASHS